MKQSFQCFCQTDLKALMKAQTVLNHRCTHMPTYCTLCWILTKMMPLYFQMKAFQREHPNMGTGTRAFSQAIEAVETNIIWMSKNYESVKQWLERPVRV